MQGNKIQVHVHRARKRVGECVYNVPVPGMLDACSMHVVILVTTHYLLMLLYNMCMYVQYVYGNAKVAPFNMVSATAVPGMF